MTREASEIYDQLITLKNDLEALGGADLISMAQDSSNTDFREVGPAMNVATESLERAADAMYWMQTKKL